MLAQAGVPDDEAKGRFPVVAHERLGARLEVRHVRENLGASPVGESGSISRALGEAGGHRGTPPAPSAHPRSPRRTDDITQTRNRDALEDEVVVEDILYVRRDDVLALLAGLVGVLTGRALAVTPARALEVLALDVAEVMDDDRENARRVLRVGRAARDVGLLGRVELVLGKLELGVVLELLGERVVDTDSLLERPAGA